MKGIILDVLRESIEQYAYRGSKFEDDDGSKSRFGPSGYYYPAKYFYTGDNALQKAKDFGQYMTKVDISNAKLYPITYKNADDIEREARNAGFYEYGGGYNVVRYLKSLGYDGIQRGIEIILFDHDKFNPQKITSDSMNEHLENKEDIVSLNIPLLLRLLEYAKEDAKTDMDLHFVIERLVKLSSKGAVLRMNNYNTIVNQQQELASEHLTESYESQKELEWLADDIVSMAAYEFLNTREHDRLPSIPISKVLSQTDKQYQTLKKFIGGSFTRIRFAISNNKNLKGDTIQSGRGEMFTIKLYYDNDKYSIINQVKQHETYDQQTKFKVLKNQIDRLFGSTMLHELQHAYDGFISKGKALSAKGDIVSDEKRKALSTKAQQGLLTPEEQAELDKSYNDYLNYKYEINARFAQTIRLITFFNTKYGDGPYDDVKKELYPWENVNRQFFNYFQGWNVLSDKMKKRLTSRLFKVYEKVREEFDKT